MSDGFGHEKPGEGITNDWITPRKLIQQLGDSFDLDPCESNTQPWPCAANGYRLGRGEDGLLLPWQGSVYCNPPYGPHVSKWVRKMELHRNGIMLIFLRAETEAWRDIFKTADAFLFPYGRTCFYLPDGTRAKSGTAPSALVAYGQHSVDLLKSSKLAGAFFHQAWITEGVKISTL